MPNTRASIAKNLNLTFRAGKRSTNDLDIMAIKRTVINADCSLTLPTGTCAAGDLQELRMLTRGGTEVRLVSDDSANPTRVGNWTVKATCNATGNGVLVQAALQRIGKAFSDSDADFYPDPLTQEVRNWDHEKTYVFGPDFNVCLLDPEFKSQLRKSMSSGFVARQVTNNNGEGAEADYLGDYDLCVAAGFSTSCNDCAPDDKKTLRYRCQLTNPGARQWYVQYDARNSGGKERLTCYFLCKNFD